VVSKPVLILLPGLLCDERLWWHQMETLGDIAEVRCANLTGQETISCMAGAVLADAPERFAVAGLSMGGLVAFEIMRQAWERVTHLALLDTNHRPFTREQTENYQMYIEMAKSGQFDDITNVHLLPLLTNQRDDLTGTICSMAQAIGKVAFIRQARATMNRPDSSETLKRVQCPTLVLGGREDALCPVDWHQDMAALADNSSLVIVDNCGHLSSLEQPEAVSTALRQWLGQRIA
jgi:pimeloyl-ACP methyl ester carboxylesterase